MDKLVFALLIFLGLAFFVIAFAWAIFLGPCLWLLKRRQGLMRTGGLFTTGFIASLILFGLANFAVFWLGDLDSFFGEMIELPEAVYGFPFVFMRQQPEMGSLDYFNFNALTADALVTIVACVCLAFAFTKARKFQSPARI